MQPGRELDVLVAEKVMGWDVGDIYYDETWQEVMPRVPAYSTSIADAWLVVDAVKAISDGIVIQHAFPEGPWLIWLTPQSFGVYLPDIFGKTAPHAICLAALKVKRVKI